MVHETNGCFLFLYEHVKHGNKLINTVHAGSDNNNNAHAVLPCITDNPVLY